MACVGDCGRAAGGGDLARLVALPRRCSALKADRFLSLADFSLGLGRGEVLSTVVLIPGLVMAVAVAVVIIVFASLASVVMVGFLGFRRNLGRCSIIVLLGRRRCDTVG